MLHNLPPPETKLRRRNGYTPIEDPGEGLSPDPSSSEALVLPHPEETDNILINAQESVKHDGWMPLITSFALAGATTV